MTTKLVNMRLGKKTLDILSYIEKELETGNRAQAIAYSARLTKQMVGILKRGEKIIVLHNGGVEWSKQK